MKIAVKASILTSLFIILLDSANASTFNKNLSLGSKDNEVTTVQQFLISKNFLTGSTTGYFGVQTKKAVQDFQRKNNLPATGAWFDLTRKKAESLLGSNQDYLASSTFAITTSLIPKKEVRVVVSNTIGGNVTLPDGKTCYSNESCTITASAGSKIALKAYPLAGYVLKQWSRAECGNSQECAVSLDKDTEITVTFSIPERQKVSASITSPKNNSVCYIQSGKDYCVAFLDWSSNVPGGVALTDNFEVSKIAPSNNVVSKFPKRLTLGPHELRLKNAGDVLDMIKINAQCADDLKWTGVKCASSSNSYPLFITRSKGILVTSDPANIYCEDMANDCYGEFPAGTKITVTALADDGHVFSGWTGDCVGTSTSCSFVLDKIKIIGVNSSTKNKFIQNMSTENIGNPVPGCVPNWKCGDWGSCSNQQLVRSCSDLNKCNNLKDKPQTILSCETQIWDPSSRVLQPYWIPNSLNGGGGGTYQYRY